MALQTLLRQLRFKAPPHAQRLSGDCFEGLTQYGNMRSTLLERVVPSFFCGSTPGHVSSADRLLLRRGYSSGASLIGTDNGCISLNCPSHSTMEGISSTEEDTTVGVNMAPKISGRHNLAMIFTCTVCQTRSAKTMSRQTYEKGVVIVRCGGCKNLHLIADRLGWFGEPGSVEDFLKQKGVEIRKGSEESYEFTVEDLAGWSPPGKE